MCSITKLLVPQSMQISPFWTGYSCLLPHHSAAFCSAASASSICATKRFNNFAQTTYTIFTASGFNSSIFMVNILVSFEAVVHF